MDYRSPEVHSETKKNVNSTKLFCFFYRIENVKKIGELAVQIADDEQMF